jgi:hypothetical protein
MATEMPRPPGRDDWRDVHALGLPAGSIRALLAVLVFATVWGMLLVRPSQEVPDYLGDLLFVIMGHYFAARRSGGGAREPGEESGPPPLYLPRGSVRMALVAGTAAVAAVLYRRGVLTRVDRNPGVTTLVLVCGFLVGVVLNALTGWWRQRVKRRHRALEGAQAVGAMAAALLLIALACNRLYPFVPPEQLDAAVGHWAHLGRLGPEHLLAARE